MTPDPELRDYWAMVWRRKWWLAASTIVCVSSVALYNRMAPREYECAATLVLQSSSRTPSLAGDAATLMSFAPLGTATDLYTQVEVAKSDYANQRAAYLVNEAASRLAAIREGTALLEADDGTMALLDRYTGPAQVAGLRGFEKLTEDLVVQPVSGTNVIEIRLVSSEPERAVDYVNALALAVLAADRKAKQRSARAARENLDEALADVRRRLSAAQTELEAFLGDTGTQALDQAMTQRIAAIAALETDSTLAQSDLSAGRVELDDLRRKLASTNATIVSSSTIAANPIVEDLQRELKGLEVERAAALEEYAATSTVVRDLEAKIAETNNRLAEEMEEVIAARVESVNPLQQELARQVAQAEAELLGLAQRRDVLAGAIAAAEGELQGLPEAQARLVSMQRELQVTEAQYQALCQKREEYRLAETAAVGDVRALDYADLPEEPVRPRPLLNLLVGGIIGLLLGLVCAFLAEYADDTYKSPSELERAVRAPVLGVVSELPQAGVTDGEDSREAFGAIAAALGLTGAEGQSTPVLVTSARPGEGRSTVAAALQAAAAGDKPGEGEDTSGAAPREGRVVVIDAPIVSGLVASRTPAGEAAVLVVDVPRTRRRDVVMAAEMLRENNFGLVGCIMNRIPSGRGRR